MPAYLRSLLAAFLPAFLSLWAMAALGGAPAAGAQAVRDRPPGLDVPPGLARQADLQRRFQAAMMAREGVVGFGIGENAAGRPVLRILLARQGIGGLPASLEGVEVETLVTGRILAGELAVQQEPTGGPVEAVLPQSTTGSPRERWPRPVPIGVSLGHQDVTAGTLGCQVLRSGGCHTDFFVLSNNHVLANRNLGLAYDQILQPGAYDGGTLPGDTVAWLQDFEPIDMSTTASNIMDAAIALTNPGLVGSATPPDGYGMPGYLPVQANLNMRVQKYGRTTRLTTGRVSLLNATLQVDYSNATAQFVGQIVVTGDNDAPFSQGGDSGSLVVGSGGPGDRRPVGLLFAGSGNLSVASPIQPILNRFGVSVAGN